uniref:Uncharacterized protein n=1 Tax=Peronospora matthiolae TaxID=2874970 RepID=A0AAV1VKP6_9STRA
MGWTRLSRVSWDSDGQEQHELHMLTCVTKDRVRLTEVKGLRTQTERNDVKMQSIMTLVMLYEGVVDGGLRKRWQETRVAVVLGSAQKLLPNGRTQ